MPCFDSAEAAGAYHDSDALNLAKRRLCDAVGINLGSAAQLLSDFRRPCPCCTHRLHPPIEPPLARRANLGAAKAAPSSSFS
jgi:hypothetical protein